MRVEILPFWLIQTIALCSVACCLYFMWQFAKLLWVMWAAAKHAEREHQTERGGR
jgi:flagellar basal body-associated protein FliL